MKHPEIILLPILMFLDYFLTVLGATLKEKKHSEHFKSAHYELNPIWQRPIAKKKWFNPRHLFLTLLVSGLLFGMIECTTMPEYLIEGVLGCFFVLWGMIIGRHLSNIMIFRYLIRKPDDISGEVTVAHTFSLYISTYQYLVAAIPIALIAVFTPTPFVLGGLVGVCLLFVVHFRWAYRHKQQLKKANPTETAGNT